MANDNRFFSPRIDWRPMSRPILVLDTASPAVSVAVGAAGRVTAERTIELRRSSERLLKTIEEVLEAARLTLGDLDGVAVLQGPGSFTGLRIGLATVLGFHQALGLSATALPTLPVLAAAAGPGRAGAGETPLAAAVDALRGDWFVGRFRPPAGGGWPEPLGPAALRASAALAELSPCRLIGFGVAALAPAVAGCSVELVEPPPLAPVAARVASRLAIDWDPERLTAPIYFRPPAVTLPAPRAAGR